MRLSMAFTGRNSPTQTMSVASGRGVIGANSAAPTPLRTTRVIAGVGPISARNSSPI